jgi:peptidoglycan/LPS O-acetylase OafA/YrhL
MSTAPTRDHTTTPAQTRDYPPPQAGVGSRPEASGGAQGRGRRLAWLDALRGIAALCVLQVGAAAVFLAALLACCAATYYLVEAPMQRLGRRVAARLDARFGPDRLEAARTQAS